VLLGEPEDEGWRRMVQPGFPAGLGSVWARRVDAGWEYGLALAADHANPAGKVHGGVLLALADHALSLVAWQAAGRVPCATIQLSMQFLRPVEPEGFLRARGEVVRLTGSLVFMRGILTASDGGEVAAADGIWRTQRAGIAGAADPGRVTE
jgi:uncharacterized protein (TIGR00369 family)